MNTKLLKSALLTQRLDFDLILPTPDDFLKRYLQFGSIVLDQRQDQSVPDFIIEYRNEPYSNTIAHPKFSAMLYAKASNIIDYAVMDYQSLEFSPSILAAGVFFKAMQTVCIDLNKWAILSKSKDDTVSKEELLLFHVTGYRLDQIKNCLKFLEPYSMSDLSNVFNDVGVLDLIQKWDHEGRPFRLEEDQLVGTMKNSDYGNFLLMQT
jgi:hypothetical protein